MREREYKVPFESLEKKITKLDDVPVVVMECITHVFGVDEYILSGSHIWREYCGFTGNVRNLHIMGRSMESYLGLILMMEDFAWTIAAFGSTVKLENVSLSGAIGSQAEFIFTDGERNFEVTLTMDEGVYRSNIWACPNIGAVRIVTQQSMMAELLSVILRCDVCPAELSCFCDLLSESGSRMAFNLNLVRTPLCASIGFEQFHSYTPNGLRARFHSLPPYAIKFLYYLLIPVAVPDKYVADWFDGEGEGVTQFSE